VTWFKSDDRFTSHPKVKAIPRPRLATQGLWHACGIWSALELTDGLVPADVVVDEGGKPSMAKQLVAVGLWHDSTSTCDHDPEHCPGIPAPGHYQFHDWFDYQRARADVLAERAATAERVAKHRRKRASNGVTNAAGNGVSSDVGTTPPVPGPVPNPLITLVCRRLSSDTRTTTTDEEIRIWQEAAGGADLADELKAWLMHNAGTDLRDPGAALLGWLRKAAARHVEHRAGAHGDPDADIRPPEPTCPDPACVGGYLGFDHDERPIPCPACRPHLRPLEAS
jgi:hypothetical protein